MYAEVCSYCRRDWKESYIHDGACYHCGNTAREKVRKCPHCLQEWGKDWGAVTCLLCSEQSYEPKTLQNVLKQISSDAEQRVSEWGGRSKMVCGNCLQELKPAWGDICGWCGHNSHERIPVDNHRGDNARVILGPEHLVICHACLRDMNGFVDRHPNIIIGLALVKKQKDCDLCQDLGEWLYFTVAVDKSEESDTVKTGKHHGA